MLEAVVISRGQIWVSNEVRESLGFEPDENLASFAICLNEAIEQPEEQREMSQVARCA